VPDRHQAEVAETIVIARRDTASLGAVLLALVAAFGGAVLTRDTGGAVALLTADASAAASDMLQGVIEALPLGYAFALGMAAAVNPCGFALLPTYLGLYLGTAAGERLPLRKQLGRAVLVSLAMTASFVALFGAAGIVFGAAGAALGRLLPWLSLATGVLLVAAGGRLLAGGSFGTAPAERLADRLGGTAARTGLLGYAAYGLAFALSSLGCTLPLFLTAVGTGVARGGLAGGVSQMLLYALGMSAVVSILTVLVALFGRGVLARVRNVGRLLAPLGALLLLTTGGYIVYYWLSVGGILG